MNKTGKVLTVFLVIAAILLVSLAAISMFFFQKELERRKSAEANLAQSKELQAKLEAELKEVQKKLFLVEEKNKEADEQINSLLDELELEQGLREEMKIENQALKETLESESAAKVQIRQDLTQQIEASETKIGELESKLNDEMSRKQELETLTQELQTKIKTLELSTGGTPSLEEKINLDKIVVNTSGALEGKVLTVDTDNDFVIFSLGAQDGVNQGDMMSVFRGERYLGDVRVSRVQPEMSAADFIPPLSAQKVQKNDRVVNK